MLNKPEIMFIILGLVFAIISGLIFPSFALFTGELLDVSSYAGNHLTVIMMHNTDLTDHTYVSTH